jgi:photosystem II stability/assembly factor-like uncharacterized protein
MAHNRISRLFFSIILLTGFAIVLASPGPVIAETPLVKWTEVNIPEEGEDGKWVLASGSDIRHLTQASDDTLYVYADPPGTNQRLFKSTDNGTTWIPTGSVTTTIIDIVTVPGTNNIFYATDANIYISSNAGVTFNNLPPNPGGAGANGISITSIAVAKQGDSFIVAVATKDVDYSQYGGVYILDGSQFVPTWENSNIGNYDVLAVSASPGFSTDREFVVVATDETNSIITGRIGNTSWGNIVGEVILAGKIVTDACIAFPSDYIAISGSPAFFVAINTGVGTGDVYKINVTQPNPIATDLNCARRFGLDNTDIGALAISSNSTGISLMAGASGSGEVYYSHDGGLNWTTGQKNPTGQSITTLIMCSDLASTGRSYAGTSGVESAISVTFDGSIWNQISFIDTNISSSGIIDMAVSPDTARERTLFLLTSGDTQSLWRSRDDGTKWERVFGTAFPEVDTISSIRLSPQYGQEKEIIYLTGISGILPVILKSTDGGQIFTLRGTPFSIDTWTIISNDALVLGGYDGTDALVCFTQGTGLLWSNPAPLGNQPLVSIALSPDYEKDKTILIGNTAGEVFLSTDNGTSFQRLGDRLPVSGAGEGMVTVVFSNRFTQNKAVYATSSATSTTGSRERIFRFIIGKSDKWESINSTLPVGSIIGQMCLSPDGTFYSVNSRLVSSSTPIGGIERCLSPTTASPVFETVIRGLTDGVVLSRLWLRGNQLWSIDTVNTRLMTFIDSLSKPVTLNSPEDEATGLETSGIRLDWQAVSGATKYQWQVDYDGDFSTVSDGFEGDSEGSSIRLPVLEMATTYYWRVKVITPNNSPWSVINSFTTKLGEIVNAPELYTPKAGAVDTPPQPVFQWSAIKGAEKYELLVSPNVNFSSPVLSMTGDGAVPSTAWQSEVKLVSGQTYYWKVRAVGAGSNSSWSPIGGFTISPEPLIQSTMSTPFSPVTTVIVTEKDVIVSSSGLPVWVLWVAGILGLTLIVLLIAILVVLVRNR